MSTSDSESTSSGSVSALDSPHPPASTRQQPSIRRSDDAPSRYTSRQSSEYGARPSSFLELYSDRQNCAHTPNLAASSMTPEARRRTMIAMDRKRRLTSSQYEQTRRPYAPAEFLTRNRSDTEVDLPSPVAATVPDNREASQPEIVDLTESSPPPPPPRPPVRQNQASRTSSSSSRRYVVPSWQPDAEVSHCPICKKQFTWLFRRHHCRKCGRVVCDNCSPHRITIPRQFIVNPPGPDLASSPPQSQGAGQIETIDLTGDDEGDDTFRHQQRVRNVPLSTLEGGEKVRLCNPCVPDPQPEPPPNFPPFLEDAGSGPFNTRFPLVAYQSQPRHTTIFGQPRIVNNPAISQPPRDTMAHSRIEYPASPSGHARPAPVTNPFSMYFPDHEHRVGAGGLSGSTIFSGARPNNNPLPQLPGMNHLPSPIYPHGRYSSLNFQNRPQPSPSGRPRGSSMIDFERRHAMTPLSLQSRPPVPAASRPRMHERDICPVCRRPLPPRGENGDESAREAHIMTCISARDPSLAATSEPGSSSRGTIHMVAFTASEKDCVGEEGNAQECSICMVEYDVGDELARLECFCKFHKECIVSWLNRKAECPVHKASRFNV